MFLHFIHIRFPLAISHETITLYSLKPRDLRRIKYHMVEIWDPSFWSFLHPRNMLCVYLRARFGGVFFRTHIPRPAPPHPFLTRYNTRNSRWPESVLAPERPETEMGFLRPRWRHTRRPFSGYDDLHDMANLIFPTHRTDTTRSLRLRTRRSVPVSTLVRAKKKKKKFW